jgi:putative transcriptional regulator
MEYQWDAAKAAENRCRHGIDFADSIAAIEDPNRLEEIDTRFEDGEERIRVIGMAVGTVLFVVTTCRSEGRAASSPPGGQRDMSKTGTTRMTVKPGEAPPRGETDWARVNAMTDEEVLAAAHADPDAQPLAAEALAKMRRVSPVKALRQRLGMTQAEFAEAFGLLISTLRDWEQLRSNPDAPARALLRAIEREPDTMRRLLSRVA